MMNKNYYFESILQGNKTIIIYKEIAESIFVPLIWIILVVTFLFIIFILCRSRDPEGDSDVDDPFELSRIQPNHCNTNCSTEMRSDSRRNN